jgi:hypothetical protein
MPWRASVAAPSTAGHLNSLHLINWHCRLHIPAAAQMMKGMRCLQALIKAAPVTAAGTLLTDVALTAI